MRKTIALTLACLALPATGIARPLDVHVRVHRHASRAAGRVLVSEGILTPAQLTCTDIVRGRLGSARVEQVSLYQRHGGICPGTPQPPTYLFDLYVDTISGVVDYTPDSRGELVTVLPGEHVIQ